jgi:hypothetical protein
MDAITPTAEIVTFRSCTGVSDAAIARAAEGMAPLLARAEGFPARSLSVDATGTWTDHVAWADAALARRAAAGRMADPAAQAFMALIDTDSVRMNRARILVAQKAA